MQKKPPDSEFGSRWAKHTKNRQENAVNEKRPQKNIATATAQAGVHLSLFSYVVKLCSDFVVDVSGAVDCSRRVLLLKFYF